MAVGVPDLVAGDADAAGAEGRRDLFEVASEGRHVCVVVVVVGDRDATGAAAVRRERKVSDAVRGEIQEGAAGEDGIVRDGSRVFARS